MSKATKHFGFISLKERWGLTLWGWLLLLIILQIPVIFFFRSIYGILAPVHREKSEILILEGFISDYVLKDAIDEFHDHGYKLLISTGTPLEQGQLLANFKNTANLVGESLLRMGFDSNNLVVIGTDEIRNDRTFNSALALKKWLVINRPETRAINLMTMNVHGARSQMLFQYALGDSIRVGIISVENFYYGPNNWWKSSKGFRETMNEAFGYFYTRFFFRPYNNTDIK